MASQPVGSVTGKKSFAKIAAMPPRKNAKNGPNSQFENQTQVSDKVLGPKSSQTVKNSSAVPKSAATASPTQPTVIQPTVSSDLSKHLSGLSLIKEATLQKIPSVSPNDMTVPESEMIENDHLRWSNSSIKPPSFDGKSLASVTTFAMDEKESILPDDSASVQAGDDDESLGSFVSHHKDTEMINNFARHSSGPEIPAVIIPDRQFSGIPLSNPPRFGEITPVPDNAKMARDLITAEGPSRAEAAMQPPMLVNPPDEKLLDALATPKDRLPLLHLEQRILLFISQASVGDVLDLPPQNSFERLLAHKLADYYSLAHHNSEEASSVRMYRTPYSTLPTPLHVLAASIPVGTVPPSSATVMKIMRRSGLGSMQRSTNGSTGASSSVASKATSENGADNTSDEGMVSQGEGTPSKDKSKLTREEREAHYKAARERIFGDFQESVTSEAGSAGEASANISRSSSSSGKRKSRKNKNTKDDGFEARSQFIPSYSGMAFPALQIHYAPSYASPTTGHPYVGAGSEFPRMNYGTTPTQAFPGFEQNMSFNAMSVYPPQPTLQHQQPAPPPPPPQYNSNPSWPNQPSHLPGGYAPYNGDGSAPFAPNGTPVPSSGINPYMQTGSAGMHQMNGWGPPQFGNNVYQQPSAHPSSPMQWPSHAEIAKPASPSLYQFGQLPPHSYVSPAAYNAQHPIPGSYHRSLFNPQTRSFVPNNASSRSGGRNQKKPHGRNGDMQSQVNSDGPATVTYPPFRNMAPAGVRNGAPNESLQQKWGTPAHLPKKPPPSQIASNSDIDHVSGLPSQQSYAPGSNSGSNVPVLTGSSNMG